MSSTLKKIILLSFSLILVTHCAPKIYPSISPSSTTTTTNQRYAVNFTLSDGTSALRTHTCYAVTVSLSDSTTGNSFTPTSTTSVSISPSTGVYAYDSLDACYAEETTITQTYLTPSSPTKVIYIKMDTVGSLTLGGASSGFSSNTSTLTSYFTSTNSSTGPNSNVNVMVEDTSTGKYYIGGTFTYWSGYNRLRIARINTDGTLDTSFDPGAGFDNAVSSIVLQSDGKIVVGGYFTTYRGVSRNGIARLNTDGTLDTTFSIGTGFSSACILTLAIHTDGSIFAGGSFSSFNGTSRNNIAKLTSTGTIDSTFNPSTGFNSDVNTIALQTDGKLVVGGNFTTINGTGRNYVARLNTNGTNDTTFSPGTACNGSVATLLIQSDGNIILGGSFTTYNGTSRNRIVRVSTLGALDGTFNPGTGFDSSVFSIAQQTDGKTIVIGGFSYFNGTSRPYLARLTTSGTNDPTYSPGTGPWDYSTSEIIVLSTGKFLIGGGYTSYNGTVVKYIFRTNSDGSLDSTFNPITGLNYAVKSSVLQSDGKIVLAGYFTMYNSTSTNYIARISADGTLDTSFNVGTGFNNYVWHVALQTDGKILAGGTFTSYNGTSRNRIIRLNSDGSVDTSFSIGTGFNNGVMRIIPQSSGKILVSGAFSTYNGTSRNGIARLNSDGSLDTSFNPGTGFNGGTYPVVVQTDGKILVGGNFTTFNGTTRNSIARLNTDGSLDTTFANTGTGFDNTAFSIALQTDGKIIVGGYFTNYNGTTVGYIVRLDSTGTLDTSFSTGSGFDSYVESVVLQSDEKVLVGGFFTNYNGVSQNYFVRLNSDGSKDTAFNTDTGFDKEVRNILIQPDRKIFVTGAFSAYKNNISSYFTRLTIKGALD